MNKTVLILGLIGLLCAVGRAKEFLIMSGSASDVDRNSISFETRLEMAGFPSQSRVIPAPVFRLRGRIILSDEAFHRLIINSAAKTYIGYDIKLEATGAGGTRVKILALSMGPERMNVDDPGSWRELGLPKYPPPQFVENGDTLALDLLVDRLAGQKMVDYLTFRGNPLNELRAAGATRYLSLPDVDFSCVRPRIRIKDQASEIRAGRTGHNSLFAFDFRHKRLHPIALEQTPQAGLAGAVAH